MDSLAWFPKYAMSELIEASETYKRLLLDYTYGLDKIYTRSNYNLYTMSQKLLKKYQMLLHTLLYAVGV